MIIILVNCTCNLKIEYYFLYMNLTSKYLFFHFVVLFSVSFIIFIKVFMNDMKDDKFYHILTDY